MKVFIQIIDSKTGIYQSGMIDEPVVKGLEIQNAIGHFEASTTSINWTIIENNNNIESRIGYIDGTSKIVTAIKVVNDQPSC